MTSTPVNLLHLRSVQSSDRPTPTTLQLGQLALSYGSTDPGLYFEDSAGAIRKIGPNHYAATAPNASPLGQSGNSVGETWVDSSTASYYMKVWNGSTWLKVGAGFADNATTATSATTANLAASSTVASGVAVSATLPGSAPQGQLIYRAAAPSGLFIYVGSAWVPVV